MWYILYHFLYVPYSYYNPKVKVGRIIKCLKILEEEY